MNLQKGYGSCLLHLISWEVIKWLWVAWPGLLNLTDHIFFPGRFKFLSPSGEDPRSFRQMYALRKESWLPKWLCKLSAGKKRVQAVALLWVCEWLRLREAAPGRGFRGSSVPQNFPTPCLKLQENLLLQGWPSVPCLWVAEEETSWLSCKSKWEGNRLHDLQTQRKL